MFRFNVVFCAQKRDENAALIQTGSYKQLELRSRHDKKKLEIKITFTTKETRKTLERSTHNTSQRRKKPN